MKKQLILASLTAIALAGCHMNHEGKDGEEENEQKVAMSDAPAPVRAAFEREAGGATIKTVDKEMRHGKEVYEADAMIGGKNYEIVVSPDGKLVSKKLDAEEEDEKGEAEHEGGKKGGKHEEDDEK